MADWKQGDSWLQMLNQQSCAVDIRFVKANSHQFASRWQRGFLSRGWRVPGILLKSTGCLVKRFCLWQSGLFIAKRYCGEGLWQSPLRQILKRLLTLSPSLWTWGLRQGALSFFPAANVTNQNNMRDTWLCQLALSKSRVPPDGLSASLFDGHNWGTPVD